MDSLCRRFHLWERLGRIEGIDPRKRKGSGHDPEAMAAQILFTLTSGGITLADAERIGQDAVLLESVGLEKVADQTTLGECLRAQSSQSVRRLCELNSDFVTEVIGESKPARVRHGGELEVFFDDTEIEVYGKKIEGARINYNGDLALSWQTLWAGPLLLDQELGGLAPSRNASRSCSGDMPLWRARRMPHAPLGRCSSATASKEPVSSASAKCSPTWTCTIPPACL